MCLECERFGVIEVWCQRWDVVWCTAKVSDWVLINKGSYSMCLECERFGVTEVWCQRWDVVWCQRWDVVWCQRWDVVWCTGKVSDWVLINKGSYSMCLECERFGVKGAMWFGV